mmetsp:Transcript_16639/g.46051  ORF Transcript_16639/g.46051 Transcript_16639/m.46051 type:complete len:305 (+) Transcript_16639:49-963(+)
MVFQEESSVSWLWPLRRSPSGEGVGKGAATSESEDEDVDRWGRERAFDIADMVEQGMAREIVTEFMHPLRKSSKLWRFHVVRSEDKLQYRLFSDDGDFLMYARTALEARRVDFYLYNPSEKDDKLFDPSRPAFTMGWNKDKTEWRIVQERCEHCQFSPKHLSCSCHGKQQVAVIKHARRPVGDGIFNCMEVLVPGLYSDGSRVVWCPLLGRGDLAAPGEDSDEAQRLITKKPTWNDEVESLVLDFKGRNILSSAKNFQLALSQKPEHTICQYGKIGPMTFSLDFKYPLSVIQAFGISLTTLFWT